MIDASNVVYDSKYPSLGILTLIGYNLFSAVLFGLSWLRFDDFPIFVYVTAMFMLLVFFFGAMQKIVVERDRFVIVTWRIIPVLRRQKSFLFSDVQSIEAHLPLTQRGDLAQNESAILYGSRYQKRPRPTVNTLIIKNKEGIEVKLSPSIYRQAFSEALGHIGKLSKIGITTTNEEES